MSMLKYAILKVKLPQTYFLIGLRELIFVIAFRKS